MHAQVTSLVNAMNSNLANCFLKMEKPEKAVEKATLVSYDCGANTAI